MDPERLKKLVERERFTMKAVIKDIGMSEGGFYRAIKNESLRIRDLESIAKLINVPVAEFFQDLSTIPLASDEWKEKYFTKVERCNELLEENAELRRRLNFKQ